MELQGNLSSLRAFGEWYGAHFAVLHSPYLIVACDLFRNENLGHPPPDERHCVNSSSLTFEPGPEPDDELEEEQVPESNTRRRLVAENPGSSN